MSWICALFFLWNLENFADVTKLTRQKRVISHQIPVPLLFQVEGVLWLTDSYVSSSSSSLTIHVGLKFEESTFASSMFPCLLHQQLNPHGHCLDHHHHPHILYHWCWHGNLNSLPSGRIFIVSWNSQFSWTSSFSSLSIIINHSHTDHHFHFSGPAETERCICSQPSSSSSFSPGSPSTSSMSSSTSTSTPQ